MLVKLMFLSSPMDATWRLFGSMALKPRKQPLVAVVVDELVEMVMFLGTSERMTWLLTFKVDSDRVKVKDELEIGLTCLVVVMLLELFLVELRVGFGGDIFLVLLIENWNDRCVCIYIIVREEWC
jgi:hypothetical protein